MKLVRYMVYVVAAFVGIIVGALDSEPIFTILGGSLLLIAGVLIGAWLDDRAMR